MNQAAAIDQNIVEDTPISSSIIFQIDRSLLLKSLGHVQSVVERRNTIPILSNVKIEAVGSIIKLTATDMDLAVTEQVPADISQEGALTVPAHTLYDIVRKLPDGSQIQFSGDAMNSGKLNLVAGTCEFSLSCLPVTDFPVMDKGNMTHHFNLAPAEITALFDKCRFAISTEETRYYLNGIYFHVLEKEGRNVLAAVATDGHRLAKIELDAPEGAKGMPGVIIPRKTVVELKKLLDEVEGEVSISLSDTKIYFSCGNAELLSKLIDGTFPDYQKVIPTNNNNVMKVDTKAFARSIDRVSTIASEKTKAIKLTVESGQLTLWAANEENGSGHELLEVAYDQEALEIGFNSRYLLEMMVGLEGDSVQFSFADSASPAIVHDADDQNALYVIMPMRI